MGGTPPGDKTLGKRPLEGRRMSQELQEAPSLCYGTSRGELASFTNACVNYVYFKRLKKLTTITNSDNEVFTEIDIYFYEDPFPPYANDIPSRGIVLQHYIEREDEVELKLEFLPISFTLQ